MEAWAEFCRNAFRSGYTDSVTHPKSHARFFTPTALRCLYGGMLQAGVKLINMISGHALTENSTHSSFSGSIWTSSHLDGFRGVRIGACARSIFIQVGIDALASRPINEGSGRALCVQYVATDDNKQTAWGVAA